MIEINKIKELRLGPTFEGGKKEGKKKRRKTPLYENEHFESRISQRRLLHRPLKVVGKDVSTERTTLKNMLGDYTLQEKA